GGAFSQPPGLDKKVVQCQECTTPPSGMKIKTLNYKGLGCTLQQGRCIIGKESELQIVCDEGNGNVSE
ncbi:hypothetical protein HispidOSU_025263, partial [Sigmodon hispidus]